ncbi:MAG: 30S ribosomal protein S17 [Chloroflexi bacterium]|nr:30S ribosomal protein S17 [Chloroflexota bacterium]MDA1218013.1 30S ribosomal protein S17 [Chloroflexota bacterium]PKB57321.1 MAG: 30S ribosomal protein S17 [SAR202 cluster bacterium Casp-Chloro-G3]
MAKEMRKVRIGSVVRTKMDKTAVVEMVWKQRHTLYSKQMRRVARMYVHDPESQCKIGDTVRIEETRPISKTKHWRLLEILQNKQLADVSPIELETEITPVMTGEALAEAPLNATSEGVEVDDGDEDEDTEE